MFSVYSYGPRVLAFERTPSLKQIILNSKTFSSPSLQIMIKFWDTFMMAIMWQLKLFQLKLKTT